MHYNRRQRRELAKQMGLIGKNESPTAWASRVGRSIEAGKQIDRQFKNNNETDMRNAEADAEAATLSTLIEKVGDDRANEIMTNNRKLAEDRATELTERRAKQKAKLQK